MRFGYPYSDLFESLLSSSFLLLCFLLLLGVMFLYLSRMYTTSSVSDSFSFTRILGMTGRVSSDGLLFFFWTICRMACYHSCCFMLMSVSSSANSSVCWMLCFLLKGGLLFVVLPLSLLICLLVSAS